MSKLTRAHWNGMNTALQNAYRKAEERDDQEAMKQIYAEIEGHHTGRSPIDVVVDAAREIRGSARVAKGKTRFTD